MIVACNADGSGIGGGSGDGTGAETEADTESGGSTAASGSASASTSATGGMGSGSSSGGGDATTTIADDGTTTDPGDGTESSTGDATTGDPGGTYPACDQNRMCPEEFPLCEPYDLPGGVGSYCTIPCRNDGDCPGPDNGDSYPACFGFAEKDAACYLDCSFGETCPVGMDCIPAFGGGFCGWPL